MITPPVTFVGRFAGSDAIATLIAFFSLFMIFERRNLAAGFALLLVSVFVRTDNVVLAGIVFLLCVLERRIKLWQAAVLGSVALGSALLINHAAGDYGIKMLYFRNFIATPLAPAEHSVPFSTHDYIKAFREGISNAAGGSLIPFVLLATIGLFKGNGNVRTILAITTVYTLLHFVILPNWQDRWFCLFYIAAAMSAVVAMSPACNDLSRTAMNALPPSSGQE
jgi:hypothetical protein